MGSGAAFASLASQGTPTGASTDQRQRDRATIRKQARFGVAVAWVAGFVDAVGFLTLYGLFTAHMSGNSVDVGLALGARNWVTALFRFTPIVTFVLGVALGSTVLEVSSRRQTRPLVAVVLGLESLLLAAYWVCSDIWRQGAVWRPADGAFYVLTALLTLAMGVQNTTLRRVGKRVIHTTFVTGMLTEVTIESIKLLFWFGDRVRNSGSHRWRRVKRALVVVQRQEAFNHSVALTGIWALYVVGAMLGTISELRVGSVALLAPVVVLLALAALDLRKPLYPSANAEWQVNPMRAAP